MACVEGTSQVIMSKVCVFRDDLPGARWAISEMITRNINLSCFAIVIITVLVVTTISDKGMR